MPIRSVHSCWYQGIRKKGPFDAASENSPSKLMIDGEK